MTVMSETDLLIERTRASLKMIAAMTQTSARAAAERLQAQAQGSTLSEVQDKMQLVSMLSQQQNAQRPTFAPMGSSADMDCAGHFIAAPFDLNSVAPAHHHKATPRGTSELPPSPEPRYRRPRNCRILPRNAPLLLRLAARGALPPHPSLLCTIMEEVDEDLEDDFYRSPSGSPFAAYCQHSGKRRTSEPDTTPQVYAQMCRGVHQMKIESLEEKLTPDALALFKCLRGNVSAA
ncbi:hypothetical protein T484DRAFT_1940308 [Baffinella frigidus]|nr:hypothetical protein T484DRAFT_1940308 [Cryptophyta sp. CCMP2293]|eukprot:CAMPEP_0180195940 /NCGR_PEP_ID=MMETSP0987-20121128/3853_1 /TAXON_ID=697907 /ORGANISM="non described non described, Strain CCMP2293" /LENGTH=233 /DNA_ID=CAMNT_0022150811 /DNA_START=29 /DNA_END=730 /DNA_ORIENTATION=+